MLIQHTIFFGDDHVAINDRVRVELAEIFKTEPAVAQNLLHIDCLFPVKMDNICDFIEMTATNSAPFKIVILENADLLSVEIQAALRRCIEIFTSSTRFFLLCPSGEHKIIDALRSRFVYINVPSITPVDHHLSPDTVLFDRIRFHLRNDQLLNTIIHFYKKT